MKRTFGSNLLCQMLGWSQRNNCSIDFEVGGKYTMLVGLG
jgi:hypothetical protein